MSHHLFVAGIDTHYHLMGAGPPVVLLHGFTESGAVFRPVRPALTGYRLLCPDLPGHGHSTLAPGYTRLEDYASWLHRLLEVLGIEAPVLIGHSMGGYVALAYAEAYPVSGLALWHSTAYADAPERRMNRERGAAFVLQHGVGRYVAGMIPQLFPTDADQHVQEVLHLARQTSQQGIVQALGAMRDRPNRLAVLQRLAAPVLFLHGKRDRIIPQVDIEEQATAVGPHARLHVLPQVAHMGMYEDPDACARVLNSFLADCYPDR